MRRYTAECEKAIRDNQPQKMVDNTSNIARLGNRVLMAAKNEADNSEDPQFVSGVNNAARKLENGKSFVKTLNEDWTQWTCVFAFQLFRQW